MRKLFFYMMIAMGFCILVPSCEKMEIESSEMDSYYQESLGLKRVSQDSVMRFKDKLDQYVSANPDAKNHEKYILIRDNIQNALTRIIIDDKWDGDSTVVED